MARRYNRKYQDAILHFNYCQVGTQLIPCPPGGLFPAIGLQREPEEVIFLPILSSDMALQVRVNMDLRWAPEEDIAMSVDCGEEEWRRLHDIRSVLILLFWFILSTLI